MLNLSINVKQDCGLPFFRLEYVLIPKVDLGGCADIKITSLIIGRFFEPLCFELVFISTGFDLLYL